MGLRSDCRFFQVVYETPQVFCSSLFLRCDIKGSRWPYTFFQGRKWRRRRRPLSWPCLGRRPSFHVCFIVIVDLIAS